VEERKRNKRRRVAMKAVEWILRQLRSLSPYLAVELLLPGGSIVALLLWTYRHRTALQLAASDRPGKTASSAAAINEPKMNRQGRDRQCSHVFSE